MVQAGDMAGTTRPTEVGRSARVLLTCTFLYALIAEVLVDVVNSVLNDIGIDEKLLGSRCSPLSRILQSS